MSSRLLLPFVLLSAAAACGPALYGQNPAELFEKAPPPVDEALRARVNLFYQAHVDGKFRLADTVVHEDSKDAYFAADKNRYRGFELVKITYTESFTRATVVMGVDTDFFMPGMGKIPVKIPLTTFWKYDQDNWWWYVIPMGEEGRLTPFGTMKPGPEREDTGGTYARMQQMPKADDITALVRVSKTTVEVFCAGGGSDEILVANGMPGPIVLAFDVAGFPGLDVKLGDNEIPGRGKGTIGFRCAAGTEPPAPEIQGMLRVQPTGHSIPVTIRLQPEEKKAEPGAGEPRIIQFGGGQKK